MKEEDLKSKVVFGDEMDDTETAPKENQKPQFSKPRRPLTKRDDIGFSRAVIQGALKKVKKKDDTKSQDIQEAKKENLDQIIKENTTGLIQYSDSEDSDSES